jgi:hypothetical protein
MEVNAVTNCHLDHSGAYPDFLPRCTETGWGYAISFKKCCMKFVDATGSTENPGSVVEGSAVLLRSMVFANASSMMS